MGGNLAVDWVAGFAWIEWQLCRGLGGSFPADWVAEFRGIRMAQIIEGIFREKRHENEDP